MNRRIGGTGGVGGGAAADLSGYRMAAPRLAQTPSPRRKAPPMDADKLHPQLRTTFRFLPTAPVATRLGRAVIRRATRLLPAGSPPVGAQSGTVDLGGGIPPVHVLNPVENASGAALLWIHGGGMVIGSPAQDYARMASLCTSLRITVVMATYRLSPEHPFPTPP